MRSVSELLDLWPSQAHLARDLGLPYQTATAWKARGSIPPGYWYDLIVAARRRGLDAVTADSLAMLHARHRKLRSLPEAAQVAEAAARSTGTEPAAESSRDDLPASTGHFSRFFHVRRPHFASMQEINDHVTALREEWDR